jgi:glycosyltransferase involved in cell wall biosynthesis
MKLLFLGLGTKDAMYEMYVRYCAALRSFTDLYCLTNKSPTSSETMATKTLNVEFSRSKPWTYLSLKKLRLMKKFILELNPDVVFIFTCAPSNIFLMRTLKRFPLICQIHDPVPHSGTAFLTRFLVKLQIKQFYRYSQKIVVSNESIKKTVLLNSKLPEAIIGVIHFPLLPVDKRCESIQIPGVKPSNDILFFGRNEYYKGLDVLSKALKLTKTNPKVVLICRGSFKKAYKKDLSFPEGTIIINSYISGEDLAKYIMESKVCVFPYRDGTGTSTVGQCYQYGTPVIASAVGAFPECVGDGGILVPPENPPELARAIDRVLEYPSLRDSLSKKALNFCQKYFSEEDFRNLYQRAFEETKEVFSKSKSKKQCRKREEKHNKTA